MPVWQQDRTHRNLGHCTPRYVLELDSKNTVSLGRPWAPGSTVTYSGSLHALCTAEASTALGSSESLHLWSVLEPDMTHHIGNKGLPVIKIVHSCSQHHCTVCWVLELDRTHRVQDKYTFWSMLNLDSISMKPRVTTCSRK